MSIATKRGRMVTNLEPFLPIKSHNHLIMQSGKMTWQTKKIFSLPYYLRPQNWQDDDLPWEVSLAGSRGKVKSLYIHYHNVYGTYTLESGYTQWGVYFHKVTRLFDHVVLQDYVKD